MDSTPPKIWQIGTWTNLWVPSVGENHPDSFLSGAFFFRWIMWTASGVCSVLFVSKPLGLRLIFPFPIQWNNFLRKQIRQKAPETFDANNFWQRGLRKIPYLIHSLEVKHSELAIEVWLKVWPSKKEAGSLSSMCFSGATVDGRNPAPVEVGSLSHYL